MSKSKQRTGKSAAHWYTRRLLIMLFAAAVWLALGGCVTVTPVGDSGDTEPVETASSSNSLRWRYVRFRLARGGDGVNSYLDLMIADQVLAPVIHMHGVNIPLWRFHRRWPEDATGHQFSFIFFASDKTAAEVTARIRSHPLLVALGDQGHLIEYRVDEGQAGDVSATSDPVWSATIQREWPLFIMGASRMWLGLLQSEAARHGTTQLHARYRATEKVLDGLWFSEGNHAFFHHLSALFGYKPLRVIRRDVMTF